MLDRTTSRLTLAAAVLVLAQPACGGDEEEAVPVDWCERAEAAFRAVDTGYAPPISFDAADEWTEAAPEDIRGSTDRAADFLRAMRSTPFPLRFTQARAEIEAYASEHCPPGIGDGAG